MTEPNIALQGALVTAADGARIEIHPMETRLIDSHGGVIQKILFPPGSPPSNTCDCCERVPSGTIARALELLDDDHPAAVLLRETRSGDG